MTVNKISGFVQTYGKIKGKANIKYVWSLWTILGWEKKEGPWITRSYFYHQLTTGSQVVVNTKDKLMMITKTTTKCWTVKRAWYLFNAYVTIVHRTRLGVALYKSSTLIVTVVLWNYCAWQILEIGLLSKLNVYFCVNFIFFVKKSNFSTYLYIYISFYCL